MHKSSSRKLKKPGEGLGDAFKQNIIEWRSDLSVKRVNRPTRLARARTLGYKAKQGIAVARVRIKRGGRKTPKQAGGRRPRRAGRFFTLNKSKQQAAEEKAAGKFKNMRVLNSYWAGEDGKFTWYEVILVDPDHPSIKRDKGLKWISSGKQRGRASRGLTSSGKKSRGLAHKGKKG
ncbi:MAG: 50S ribosomal protein L15e [Candidatus Aenigmarchaeota archaeon]|nr:50S ribosomal protein L15e [Candidatus Aenigmarchaeota archaeon]